ncbi:hypothetical protein RND81_09G178100 [Saponaria officinalis]|uniref:non-specific serine/threonine protein kinase n=1 Tax=Saponaria officinalis TaxID=3572 RepID=A0AAW1IMT7_SAPOF
MKIIRLMQSIFYHVFPSFSAILLCFFVSSSPVMPQGNETDKLALLDIKAKLIDDPLGVTKGWNDTISTCRWNGVACDQTLQRVVALNLQGLNLQGTVSPYIGNLSFLRDLQLQNNSFSGEIPSEISHLHRLQSLLLNDNSFEGKIPVNLSACSKLTMLKLGHNQLVGRIPSELGSLTNLQYLSLNVNNLTGTIPSSLGNISALNTLYLGVNHLSGKIPENLAELRNLKVLALVENSLSGEVPQEIFNISSLESLDLGVNFFRGTLPSNLGINLPNVHYFSVVNNRFSGSIPNSIANTSSLEFLQLSLNNFVGRVPSLDNLRMLQHLMLEFNYLGTGDASDSIFLFSFTNATMLQILTLNNNNFGGELTKWLCKLPTALTILKIGGNKFSGQILTCVEKLVNLQAIAIWESRLSGTIPEILGKLKNLQLLDLDQNQLSGSLPSSLGNLTTLTNIDLSQNHLLGQIPSSLVNCTNLEELDLSRNNLTGEIPSQIFGISTLVDDLNLSYNRLTGSLPVEGWDLSNLLVLDISGNDISGEIPTSLGTCVALQQLYMQGNMLHGKIPSPLNSLKSLQELDLSRNNLSGQIPDFLASLPLSKLNLSYNNFEGRVPSGGVFDNVSAVSLQGNKGLCGGIRGLELHACPIKRVAHRASKLRLYLPLLLGSLAAVLLVLCIVFYLFRLRKGTKAPASSPSNDSFLTVSYQSLLKATNGFSTQNLVGSGSFGSVYKGILETNATTVAVKVLDLERQGASKSFMAECNVLRNIRHRSLVKVLTACSGVDYRGNDFKALVYEFMVNGSLEDWLRQPAITRDTIEEKMLNLVKRVNIAVDVALALEYLHHHSNPAIVHCDLKPSNILLDGEMNARIGDFGLAKIIAGDANSTASFSSAGIRGTVGYAPPEYGVGNELSTSGDVYSFGILVLDMFSGKRPTDDMVEGSSLRDCVEAALPERLMEILDPVLIQELEMKRGLSRNVLNNEDIFEAIISVLQIGLSCSAELPHKRPDMKEVAVNLASIKRSLLGTYRHFEADF